MEDITNNINNIGKRLCEENFNKLEDLVNYHTGRRRG